MNHPVVAILGVFMCLCNVAISCSLVCTRYIFNYLSSLMVLCCYYPVFCFGLLYLMRMPLCGLFTCSDI